MTNEDDLTFDFQGDLPVFDGNNFPHDPDGEPLIMMKRGGESVSFLPGEFGQLSPKEMVDYLPGGGETFEASMNAIFWAKIGNGMHKARAFNETLSFFVELMKAAQEE